MIELLAPAGNGKNFIASINNGANAIYLGLSEFSARQNAENFTLENIQGYIETAKMFGVKIYLAVNTLVKNQELDAFFKLIDNVVNIGIDAFILQDIYIGKVLKNMYPNIELHLSTQAGVNNVYGAILAKRYGFSRVILARETNIKEIREITKIIETEVFIQGALCTCFSGQCYMSSFAGGNSGNRGLCRQPCRKKYIFKGKNINLKENYAISLSDLNIGNRIFELINAGVTSFKIEGRMRREEYTASAVKFYRDILDAKTENYDNNLKALKRIYNRGDYTLGYTFSEDANLLSREIQGHKGEFIGIVKKINDDKIFIESKHFAIKGDAFKILRNNEEIGNAIYLDENKNEKGFVALKKGNIIIGDKIYITTDKKINDDILKINKKIEIKINVNLKKNQNNFIEFILQNGEKYLVENPIEILLAKNLPLTKNDIIENFQKTGDYPFIITSFNIDIDDNIFIQKSSLNKWRRDSFESLKKYLILKNTSTKIEKRGKFDINDVLHSTMSDINPTKIAIISNDFEFLNNFDNKIIDIAIFSPNDYNDKKEFIEFFKYAKMGIETYLYIPAFANSDDLKIIEDRIDEFDGIYFQGNYGVELAKKHNKKLFYGTGNNIFNNIDIIQIDKNDKVAISQELEIKDFEKMKGDNLFLLNLGKIEVMNLCYCPFNRHCESCNIENNFIMQDEDLRKFPVRRLKLSSCRFIIYNLADLMYYETRKINSLFNFVGYEKGKQISLMNLILNGANMDKFAEVLDNYTYGHIKNGVN